MKILVTGTAGFVGFHLVSALLERGDTVVGLDNINDYYDVSLKYARLAEHGIMQNKLEYGKTTVSETNSRYSFVKADIEDKNILDTLFKSEEFDAVCNLAAQPGVRYSLENPDVYVSSNIVGFLNILECCRHHNVKNLCYASSSSVYGLNKDQPYETDHYVDHPISLYAATKKSNEMMAHVYSHLFGISVTGLRFFTVYGPWGRPDMAMFLFTKAILEDKPIDVYNHGKMERDFTYVDDIVKGVIKVIDNPAKKDPEWDGKSPSSSSAPFKLYNIGNGSPVPLMDFISEIERHSGKTANKNMMPIQAGDVTSTFADTRSLEQDLGYSTSIDVSTGVKRFIEWYRNFYQV